MVKMAEKEYLSREDAIDAVWYVSKTGIVKEFSPADVAPVVHGYLTGEGYFDELYCEFGTCSVCGEDNPIGINFCGNCGAKLDKSRKRNGENVDNGR